MSEPVGSDDAGDLADPGHDRPELLAPVRPDPRARFEAACAAAGVPPWAVAIVCGLVVAGVLVGAWWLSRGDELPPVEETLPFAEADPAPAVPTTSASFELVVHVAGAVVRPGVHRVPAGARVVDALDAAGGADATADLSRLNLAAPLVDGQQVYVVVFGENPPDGAGPTDGSPAPAGPLDLNSATATELETLPGIGPTLAAAIVDHRDEHGPFVAVESLLDVSGIGEAKLAALRDLVAV